MSGNVKIRVMDGPLATDGVGFAPLDREPFPEFVPGSVWLVGAGPGAPGLMTLLGYHALQQADAVIYDALVEKRILDWARPGAHVEYAGKRGGKPSHNQRDITSLLIELARDGRRVLRLKGGDPFIFGRGGEECQALANAGVPFRIVPGISAGVGGLAYAGIPATHREINHSVTFITGHDSTGAVPGSVNWSKVATASPVLVIYMAIKNLPAIVENLLKGGRAEGDTVAVISNASLPSQEIVHTTLGELDALANGGTLKTPSIVVVGAVSRLSDDLGWYIGALKANQIG